MGRTVRELEQTLSNDEWIDWIAYYRIDPWDEERADLRMGTLASTMVNMKIPKSKPRTKAIDFMPYVDSDEKEKIENHSLSQKIKHAFMSIGKGKK